MDERKEKFTPGPWKAHTTQHADWVMTDWIDCEEQENICDLSHSNGGNDVYLIAAAPDMYELLKEISGVFAANCCIPCHKCHELHGRIDGLLEKARGEK